MAFKLPTMGSCKKEEMVSPWAERGDEDSRECSDCLSLVDHCSQ